MDLTSQIILRYPEVSGKAVPRILFFILSAELPAQKLRQSRKSKGIKLPDNVEE